MMVNSSNLLGNLTAEWVGSFGGNMNMAVELLDLASNIGSNVDHIFCMTQRHLDSLVWGRNDRSVPPQKPCM